MTFYQQKRPGSVAPLTEPVSSTFPTKEPKMNSQSHTTAASQAATLSLDVPTLQRMSMQELTSLYDAVWQARQGLLGSVNQPRFMRGGKLNGAGEQVDFLIDYFNEIHQMIVDVARAADPATSSEIERRAFLLLKWEVYCGGDLSEIASTACQELADFSSALAQELLARRSA